MSDMMTQEEAMNMSNEQAVQILIPMRNMMYDQNGCPISDAVFALDKAIELLEKLEPLTDAEQRIFLAAMVKERAVCKKLTDEWDGMKLDVPCPVNLLRLCAEIERKVKAALWTN